MQETLCETILLTKMECGKCGIVFAMPTSKHSRCHEKGEDFYCPNGHGRVFVESENQRLQKQLDLERERVIREKSARAQASAEANDLREKNIKMVGKLSRVYKRVRNGVCPCCNRHFTNLENHMKTKHHTKDKSK